MTEVEAAGIPWTWVLAWVAFSLIGVAGLAMALWYRHDGKKTEKIVGKLAELHRAAVRQKVYGDTERAEASANESVEAADAAAAKEVERETSTSSLADHFRGLNRRAGPDD